MKDPFDILREQLVTAARPGRRRRRRTGLAFLAAVVLLGGSGVAAAVTLSRGEPSKPLSGKLPGTGRDYEIELRPDLTTGNVGWCVSFSGGSGCGPAASPQRAVIIGGGLGGTGSSVLGLVVNPRVATVVLPGGRRIAARRDPSVPAPWKIAVITAKGEVGPDLRYLDSGGHAVPDTDPPGSWAASSHGYPSRDADPDDPPAGAPCSLRLAPGTDFRPSTARVLSGPLPTQAPDAVRPSFLACATTVYYLGHTRLRAAVLLDAFAPTSTAPLLPGMTAEPAGVVKTTRLTSARRAGVGWVSAFGGSASQRAQLLRALRVTGP
jgi:hypothetical protein